MSKTKELFESKFYINDHWIDFIGEIQDFTPILSWSKNALQVHVCNVMIDKSLDFTQTTCTSGLTKPGKVGEILALYQLKSPSLDSKVKLTLPFFFLEVAPFLQIICILW